MKSATPLPPVDCEMSHPREKKKVWQVGSLTYTSSGLVVLFCWLLWGDFAWSLKERAVPSVVQLLLKKFEATDLIAGLLIGALPAGIAMILGPIISYKSDHHRGSWGRRIPYLLIPTPIAVFSMGGMAFSPQLGIWMHKSFLFFSTEMQAILFCFGFFWTLFEFASITANSVFGGLVNDVVPHCVLGRFYALFRALSLIAGMIFNFWLLGHAETYFAWIFIGIGLIYGVGFSVMCFKVREGDYPPAPPVQGEKTGIARFDEATRQYLKDCFGKSYFILYFLTIAVSVMAFNPINLYSVFYAKSIDMSMEFFGRCMAMTFLISLVISYPLGVLADRFHPLRIGLISMLLYAMVTLCGGLFVKDSNTFGLALIAHGVLSGAWLTATASLGQRLLPPEKFTQLVAAAGIVTCLCSIVVAPVTGFLLDLTHHTYRYTFLISFFLSLLALAIGLELYRQFMQRGGPEHYRTPE